MKRAILPLSFFLLFIGCYETDLDFDSHEMLDVRPFYGEYRSTDNRYRLEVVPAGEKVTSNNSLERLNDELAKQPEATAAHFRFEDAQSQRRFVGAVELIPLGDQTLIRFRGRDDDHANSSHALAVLQLPSQHEPRADTVGAENLLTTAPDTTQQPLAIRLVRTNLPEVTSVEELGALIENEANLEPPIDLRRMQNFQPK